MLGAKGHVGTVFWGIKGSCWALGPYLEPNWSQILAVFVVQAICSKGVCWDRLARGHQGSVACAGHTSRIFALGAIGYVSSMRPKELGIGTYLNSSMYSGTTLNVNFGGSTSVWGRQLLNGAELRQSGMARVKIQRKNILKIP